MATVTYYTSKQLLPFWSCRAVSIILLVFVSSHRCRQKSRERTEQPHDLSQIEVPYPKCYPPGHQPPPSHPHGGPQAGPSGPHSGDISAISHPGLVGGYPGGQRGGMYPKHVHPVIPTPRNPASPDGYHYPDDRAPMPLPPEAHEMADKCHLQQQGEHIYEKTPGQYLQQGSLRSSKGPGAKNKNMWNKGSGAKNKKMWNKGSGARETRKCETRGPARKTRKCETRRIYRLPCPANTNNLYKICTMLLQRRGRWAEPTLHKCYTNVLCLPGDVIIVNYRHWDVKMKNKFI